MKVFGLVLPGDPGSIHRFRVLSSWRERLKGLLGTDITAAPVVLLDCSSVHTFGMKYAIDVALVSKDGRVLSTERLLPPGHIASAHGAYFAFERPASCRPWFEPGMPLRIKKIDDAYQSQVFAYEGVAL